MKSILNLALICSSTLLIALASDQHFHDFFRYHHSLRNSSCEILYLQTSKLSINNTNLRTEFIQRQFGTKWLSLSTSNLMEYKLSLPEIERTRLVVYSELEHYSQDIY